MSVGQISLLLRLNLNISRYLILSDTVILILCPYSRKNFTYLTNKISITDFSYSFPFPKGVIIIDRV